MLSKRQVFDTVKTHLLTQNERSVANTNGPGGMPSCKYRNGTGLKCAAGALILDEHYDLEMEGKNVYGAAVQKALSASGVDCDDMPTFNMVARLQNIHDDHITGNWPELIDEVERSCFSE